MGGKSSAEYHRKYYHAVVDKERKVRLQLERRRQLQQFIREYLSTHPCVDCGENDPVVLDFDHITGDKDDCVSNGVRRGWGIVRLAAEIKKCEVRCANCHRRITTRRRQGS